MTYNVFCRNKPKHCFLAFKIYLRYLKCGSSYSNKEVLTIHALKIKFNLLILFPV